MEPLLEKLGWVLVDGMVASLVTALVIVRIFLTHERGHKDEQ